MSEFLIFGKRSITCLQIVNIMNKKVCFRSKGLPLIHRSFQAIGYSYGCIVHFCSMLPFDLLELQSWADCICISRNHYCLVRHLFYLHMLASIVVVFRSYALERQLDIACAKGTSYTGSWCFLRYSLVHDM